MLDELIETQRKEAHNTHVANKILDMMDKLRLSINEGSQKRWVWELIQNAKEVSKNKVKIKISLDKENKILTFSHNGKPFTTKNLVFLIEQVSSKDRETTENNTGKFGTGFLTTHLLSEKVRIISYLKDNEDSLSKFSVTLDRSGKTKNEIVSSIEKTFEELKESSKINNSELIEDNYNTDFTYFLDDSGIDVAEKGIEDLKISIKYVLAFTPTIEEVYLEQENIRFKCFKTYTPQLENSLVYEIHETKDASIINKYLIMVVENEGVRIATEIQELNGNIKILPLNKKQPRVFCNFPLIGTEEFAFPVIVDSGMFNPTEPRDGIYLTDIENEKVHENKKLILSCCELYKSLLKYASDKGWIGTYYLVKINNSLRKEWLSMNWLKINIIDNLKEFIKTCPIVDNVLGERISLYDMQGNVQIFIPNNLDACIREDIWELCRKWMPSKLPLKEDIHYWYEYLWRDCINLDLDYISTFVDKMGNKSKLTSNLVQNTNTNMWLDEYYQLVSKDSMFLTKLVIGNFRVMPNQLGDFQNFSCLFVDDAIHQEYKVILEILGEICEEYLIDKEIKNYKLKEFELINNEKVLSKILDKISKADKILIDKAYMKSIVLTSKESLLYEKQQNVLKIASTLFEDEIEEIVLIKDYSDELLKRAINHYTLKIADTISQTSSISEFSISNGFENSSVALEWLNKYVSYLDKYKIENVLNRASKPILPNQNGDFLNKDDLFLDDGEIDEELKNISKDCGYDVRAELLSKEIFLELPVSRERKSAELADAIVKFVKANAYSGVNFDNIRNIFKKIFIWINENKLLAKGIMPEIVENKHWLYDDNEIAENIKKAEAFDAILKKYNLEDTEVLEKVLIASSIQLQNEKVKEDITEDLLIQAGIYSNDSLDKVMGNNEFFADNFIHVSERNKYKFEYVNTILERSKNRILDYLREKEEYDLNDIVEIDKTIFLIKKNGEEIYIIVRPSDFGQIIVYYDSERDILDYEKDWELWIEDDFTPPNKITFGKILKMTGINRIPLKKLR